MRWEDEMDFTSEEIDRIRALRVATKQNERWRFGFNHEIRRRGTRYELHEVDVVARVHVGFDEAAVLNKVDADIAYLDEVVNMAPAMLDEIEQLQKIRQQLDDAEKSEAVLLNRAEVAEKRLRIASHIKDSDASSFDWSWLDEIERLREEVEDLQRY